MFLGNCPLTPPRTYQCAQSEKEVLMLGLGRGRWAVSPETYIIFELRENIAVMYSTSAVLLK